ncbi:facilitated trehalose transporter Tret1-like isoform X2 [Daktulosphaira vitifoliae]|uniref:facilitated trehalose transporter Tret1-like isoform X2 n=1 Tax=Daktulosphaira vitifoliae TaxID=58002 RepID=UPI0021AA4B83|nr:facilitated trehalose transporter Tret1-like isoform X2 [Daktulosphaira vitifoliae]
MELNQNIKFDTEPLENKQIANNQKESFNWAELLACISVSTTNLHTGFTVGFSAIITSQLENSIELDNLNKSDITWIASSASIATSIGCLFIAYSLDKIGRIRTFKLSLWPCFIGWLLIAIAQNSFTVIIGRILTGFSMSVGTNSANVYMAEITNPKLRGSMMSIGSVMSSFGIVFMYTVGMFFHWRVLAWMAFFSAIVPVFMTTLWTPESPMWLVCNGKNNKALKSLQYFSSNSKNVNAGKDKLEELIQIKQKKDLMLCRNVEESSGIRRILWHMSQPICYKPIIIMALFFLLQQYTGIYTIQFYIVDIFKDIAKGIDKKIATILFGVARLILSIIATGILHNYGRRPLCISTGITMGYSLLVAGICVKLRANGIANVAIIWTPLLCMILYISAGSVGLMLIPWMMPSEMLPTEVKGLFLGPLMGWCNFVMFSSVHSYSYLLILFIWIFVPETHNTKLCQIEEYFKDHTIYLLKNKPIVSNRLHV